jgi:hypothetical protein
MTPQDGHVLEVRATVLVITARLPPSTWAATRSNNVATTTPIAAMTADARRRHALKHRAHGGDEVWGRSTPRTAGWDLW